MFIMIALTCIILHTYELIHVQVLAINYEQLLQLGPSFFWLFLALTIVILSFRFFDSSRFEYTFGFSSSSPSLTCKTRMPRRLPDCTESSDI